MSGQMRQPLVMIMQVFRRGRRFSTMDTVFVLITKLALCAFTIQESNRALSHLSNGGPGLKIGQFLAELWQFLSNLLGFCSNMAVSCLINHRWKVLEEHNHLQKAGVCANWNDYGIFFYRRTWWIWNNVKARII